MTGDPKLTAKIAAIIFVVGSCVWIVGSLVGPIGWFLGAGIGATAIYAIIFTILDKQDRRPDKKE